MRYYLFISDKFEPGFSLIGGYNNKSTMIIDTHKMIDDDYEQYGYTTSYDVYTYLDTEDNTLNRIN